MRFGRYDRIVEHYGAMWPLLIPGYAPILAAMLEIVRNWERRPAILLDLGCGPGAATAAVAPACAGEGAVDLVDGSAAMLAAAQALLGDHVRRAIHGDFAEPTIAAECFPPDTYDLALACFALHHLDDATKRETIVRLGQTVKPGGMVLLADEVAVDRPAGWPLVEKVRGQLIADHLAAGRISQTFWELETSHPTDDQLPFLPARVDELTSYMARAGFAVSCPLVLLGSALLVGLRPRGNS